MSSKGVLPRRIDALDMGLEIHALGPDGEDRMVRHFTIWNYRRCIAVAGYTAGLITKERLNKEFRETADLQLFSNVKTDDDGNYINPIDGNIPDDDEEFNLDITPPEKSDTEYLYVNTIRDDDLMPVGATIKAPKTWTESLPKGAAKPVLTSMLKQNLSTEQLLTDVVYEFTQQNEVQKLDDFTKKDAREIALLGCETSDVVHDGFPVRLLGMILSIGMLEFIRNDNKSMRKALDSAFESWEEARSVAPFNGVWMQIALNQRMKIK